MYFFQIFATSLVAGDFGAVENKQGFVSVKYSRAQ